MIKSLNTKWKELLYAFSGFGPNLLMVLMGAYFTDAINPTALGDPNSLQAISGACLIMPAVFPVLWMIAKAFDGVIDVPFAAITDTLSTRWGRRRPAIVVCIVPMIVSFALCWTPISESQAANTAWIFVWALVFFATYTMCLIAFYGSLSNVCRDESQRLRVSSYKSFFDTVSYCLVYALVPVILQASGLHIDKLVFIMLPLMLTMLIPLFLIKEGAKYGYPENEGMSPEKVGLVSSMKLTFGNRMFMRWVVVNCCAFFGLQMFLVAMNAMIIGGMGMSGVGMTVLNTCAFAPVPIMLYLFNKLKKRKGVRFAFQTCLLAFAVSILSFVFSSRFMVGDNMTVKYVIGCIGGVIGSWAIGSFFMMPYLVPAQISAVEEKITGKNHSAMYFAAQALTTSVVGAVASSLVYENIKMLHISKAASGVKWAESAAEAAKAFGVAPGSVYNLGTLLVPIITCLMCVIGFILAFRMPKDYTPEIVAKELKKFNPSLDISKVSTATLSEKTERGEIIFVQVALSVLSGFLFGFIWLGLLLCAIARTTGSASSRGKTALKWALGCFVPFFGIYLLIKEHDAMKKAAERCGAKPIGNRALYIAFGILFPVLPLNVVGLSLWQCNVNRLLDAQARIIEESMANAAQPADAIHPAEVAQPVDENV